MALLLKGHVHWEWVLSPALQSKRLEAAFTFAPGARASGGGAAAAGPTRWRFRQSRQALNESFKACLV
jgi:hypothetical protein